MEDAMPRPRVRAMAPKPTHAEIEPKTGDLRLTRHMLVVESAENPSNQITLEEARKRHPAAQVGDTIADPLPPLGIRTHRRAIGKTGDRAESARGRARPAWLCRVQGSHRRYRQRHRRSRVEYGNVVVDLGRGETIVRRDELPPREVSRNGDRIRAYIYDVRREPRGLQDLPVAHASAIHVRLFAQEVTRNLRQHCRGQGGCPRSGLARQDRRHSTRDSSWSIQSAPASACAKRCGRRW